MGQAVDQARRQRELSKDALAADLQRFQARLRSEVDVRARIRQEAPRILAVAGGAVLLVGVIVLVRWRLGARHAAQASPATLDDLINELQQLRRAVEKKKEAGLVQKGVLRAVSAAAAAGGSLMARRIVESRATDLERRGPVRAG